MNIVGVTRTNSGVDYHRVFLPLRYLPISQEDMIILINEKSQRTEEYFKTADILYINRHFPGYTLEGIKHIKETYGLKLVVDLDDYWNLYKHHIIYKVWTDTDMPRRITECMKMADLVTVTHEKLYNECKVFNKNVEILPNSLPFGKDQFVFSPKEHDSFSVLYAGGNSHLHDLQSIRNLFTKLGSDGLFRSKASFVLGGYHNTNNDPRNVWHHIDLVVKKCKSYEHYGMRPVTEYMEMYDIADLSVACLENNNFNTFKSNLKTVESGCKHVPIICSNIHPYTQDTNVQGVTLANTTADWYNKIMYYIKNPNAAKDDGEALFEYVNQNYNLLTINKKRYDLLKSL